MNLVIVESPTKARKLKGYLGKDFQIEASIGHVRDLPKKTLGVDLEKDFEPVYEVADDKKEIVAKLRKLSKSAQRVYLAMDPDREGEAIAFHIQYLLGDGYKLANKKIEFLRATFNEITKSAVLKSIDNPGEINMNLVDAQQARRVLDRLVGYQVSPVLWKKIRRGLSAGRVQSVALRLIVEREREIAAFKADEFWQIEVALETEKNGNLKIISQKSKVYSGESQKKDVTNVQNSENTGLKSVNSQTVLSTEQAQYQAVRYEDSPYFVEGKLVEDLPPQVLVVSLDNIDGKKFGKPVFTEKEAEPVIEGLTGAQYQVSEVVKKERVKQSLPPLTTSLLQQQAATRLGFSSKQTMSLAQQLYEEGLITYHRTDSFNLSSQAIAMARQYIGEKFGKSYLPERPRLFKSHSKNAQEAHEAIRITDISILADDVAAKAAKLGRRHAKLYELIWNRFVGSQMSAAIYNQTTILVETNGVSNASKKYQLKATGSILKFPGWMKLTGGNGDKILPNVKKGQSVSYLDINPLQKFTQPSPRYNDASLVKELEKRGIGRPSTYASIISVIQSRAYVEKQDKRFFATPIGMTVSDFLMKNFEEMMDYGFTAEMEEDLDRISRGEKAWKKIVASFWKPFSKKIDLVTDKAERMKIPVEKTGELCPDCGREERGELVIRIGKYGKFKSCSRFPDCKYTQNIIEKIEGMTCPLCGDGEIIVKRTRWGKSFYGCSHYPKCDWASWQKPKEGEKLTQQEWDDIKAKREKFKRRRQGGKKKNAKTVDSRRNRKTSRRGGKATKKKK